MLIRVVYHGFRYDFVKPRLLGELIASGKVSMFRRRTGWVIVGIDPVRKKENNELYADRRHPDQ